MDKKLDGQLLIIQDIIDSNRKGSDEKMKKQDSKLYKQDSKLYKITEIF